MMRHIRRTFALLAVIAFAACDSSGPSDPGAAFVGTYTLISINGLSLPLTLPTDEGFVEVVSGQLVFAADGTCSASLSGREPGTTETETMSDTCTWTRTSAQISLTWSDGATDSATLQGSRVTLVASDLGGLVLTFEK